MSRKKKDIDIIVPEINQWAYTVGDYAVNSLTIEDTEVLEIHLVAYTVQFLQT